jgi:sec-independent protein translocase protein TatA
VFNSIGPTELIIVLVIVLLIFGPKRLPGLGRQLGGGMREFKESISGKGGEDDDDDADEDAGVTDAAAANRRRTEAALGRPDGESAPLEGEKPLDGEVVSERRS